MAKWHRIRYNTDIIGKRKYSLFLFDIKVLEVSGKKLYQQLQENYPQLVNRVAFITGAVIGKDSMTFMEQTSRPFLRKPFIPHEVTSVVRETLRSL